jgi:hypothetical protein
LAAKPYFGAAATVPIAGRRLTRNADRPRLS